MLHAKAPTRGSFHGAALRSKAFAPATPVQRVSLQVCNAITRQKKEEIVTVLKNNLSDSVIVFGIRYKGLPVHTIQKFRKGLPEDTRMFVCKNNLMKVAVKDLPQWAPVAERGCTGENAWLFVKENDIRDTVKHYFKFADELYAEAKKNAPKGANVADIKPPTEVSCVVMDNKYLTPAELKKCEEIPTKAELLAAIAGLAKQPATKIASGIKQIPTKLSIAIKAISELDEDKTKTVGSLVKA